MLVDPSDSVRAGTVGEEDLAVAGRSRSRDRRTSAWVLLLFDALLVVLASLYWLVQGRFFDTSLHQTISGHAWTVSEVLVPGMQRLVSVVIRLAGAFGVVFGVLAMVVAATGYRRGQAWAWYAMWTLALCPVLDMAVFAYQQALTPLVMAWDLLQLVLVLGGLLLPAASSFTDARGRSA